jgi:hypothetical protein
MLRGISLFFDAARRVLIARDLVSGLDDSRRVRGRDMDAYLPHR